MEASSDYQTLIRAALDGFWMLDDQARFLDVNDAYCEMIGYSRQELLNMSIADVEATETPSDVARHIQDLQARGSGRFETSHRTRDGRTVYLEVSAHCDIAKNRIFVFLRDITARKAADKILHQRTHELSERVKELRCLLDLSTLMERDDLTTDEVLRQAVELLPPAWQYPDLAAAQLILPQHCYATANYRPSPISMVSNIDMAGVALGQISLVYLEPPPGSDASPFLPEERLLLDAVGQRLAGFIQRQRAEKALMLREMSLNSLLDLSQRASTLRERDIIQLALEEVERLTSSNIGYLHFVNPDQSSIHLFTWSQNTLRNCTVAHDSHYPITQAGVWADSARLKRPVLHNDYQNAPDKKGYPEGHAHLVRHLSVPVVEAGAVRLIMGVGNKLSDYDDADIRQVMLTAENLWRILRRKRAEDEARREAERVATLARVAARLNANLDLPAVLKTVCEEAANALGFPAASVCLQNGSSSSPFCHTTSISTQPVVNQAEFQGELLELMGTGEWDDGIFVLPPEAPRRWVGSLIAARLAHADQNLGVLAVYTFGSSHTWMGDDLALLRGLANQAAQAIINARLFTEVSISQEKLQILSRRLVEVQEAERRHIARELHDEVGQVLTAVKINLQTLRRHQAFTNYAPRLDENIDSVQRALDQVRSLSLDLRPSILDDLGLSAALEWYTQRLAQVAGLKPSLNLPENAPRWQPEIEITCFRVAQEALTNILRHAKARRIWVDLQHTPVELRLIVRDDGQGFEPFNARMRATQSGTSVGLLSMAERVALAGGHLEIESSPGNGTSIQVVFNTPVAQ